MTQNLFGHLDMRVKTTTKKNNISQETMNTGKGKV